MCDQAVWLMVWIGYMCPGNTVTLSHQHRVMFANISVIYSNQRKVYNVKNTVNELVVLFIQLLFLNQSLF